MPKLFIAGIAIFLLLGAGYGALQAARSIPWDCSDWQAFAHSDRTTAILESLAENRGKTLYCGIDQSDTFGKAETWEAGKDRNERDDTVYWGERGSFRGFIAAQEGWLTDGESGITGQSIATIFEFPKAERRVKRTKRIAVGSGAADDDTCMTDLQEGRQAGTLICSDWAAASTGATADRVGSQSDARYHSVGRTPPQPNVNWRLNWQTNLITRTGETDSAATPGLAEWQELLAAGAARVCRARGARYVAGSAVIGPGHSADKGAAARDNGDNLGWFYWDTDNRAGFYNYRARQSRTWTATCKKTVRRSR